ncbi:MAG TPA: hypothetical protein VHR45_00410 [Thermoanaerobaculia bacterium]|nr:hypothetical protein [Thermoanaerobaculia bacterium]
MCHSRIESAGRSAAAARALVGALGLAAALLGPGSSLAAEPAAATGRAAAEVAFSDGLAEFQLGHDQEAAERFAAAARLDPEAGAPRYWQGLALLRLGRAKEAATEIAASLEARHPPEVDRARVLDDLRAAEAAASRHAGAAGATVAVAMPEWQGTRQAIDDRGSWEARVDAAAVSDSNPNLLAADLNLPTPEGKPHTLVRGEERDSLANLGLRLAWYPWHSRPGPGGWDLGLSLLAGESLHKDFGYLDLGQAHAVLQLVYGQDPRGFVAGGLGEARVPFGERRVSALLQAGCGEYQLNGAHYLRTYDGAAAVVVPETQASATQLDVAYSRRDFANRGFAQPQRTGEDITAGLGQTFFLGRSDRTVGLGVRAQDRRASREFAARALEGNATLALPLALRWSARLEGSVRRDDFKHPESNLLVAFGPKRRDTTSGGSAALVFSATPRLRLSLLASYTDRTSNVDFGAGLPDLGYRRLTVALGASWWLR